MRFINFVKYLHAFEIFITTYYLNDSLPFDSLSLILNEHQHSKQFQKFIRYFFRLLKRTSGNPQILLRSQNFKTVIILIVPP